MILQPNAGLKGSSLLNFEPRRGHRWSVGGLRSMMDAFEIKRQHRASIFTF